MKGLFSAPEDIVVLVLSKKWRPKNLGPLSISFWRADRDAPANQLATEAQSP